MKKSYEFSVGQEGTQRKGVKVSLTFSVDPNAPTMGEALVKIAKKRMG